MKKQFLTFLLLYIALNIFNELRTKYTLPAGYIDTKARIESRGFMQVPLTLIEHEGLSYKYYDYSWSRYILFQDVDQVTLRYKFDEKKNKIGEAEIIDLRYSLFTLDKIFIHIVLLLFVQLLVSSFYSAEGDNSIPNSSN